MTRYHYMIDLKVFPSYPATNEFSGTSEAPWSVARGSVVHGSTAQVQCKRNTPDQLIYRFMLTASYFRLVSDVLYNT